MSTEVVILAAGQGSRMKSCHPKVLHPLAGQPLLGHVLACAFDLAPLAVHLVLGHGGAAVRDYLKDRPVRQVEQREQLGTGHALAQALPALAPESTVVVLYGDVPLIAPKTLEPLIAQAEAGALALLSVTLDDPQGYGRVLRDDAGRVCAIVEEKDASPTQKRIQEVNTGILAVPAALLRDWLPALTADNAQGEYYLTDIIAMAAASQAPIEALQPSCPQEVQGVNNRVQLAALERWYQESQAEYWMTEGVTILDPHRVEFRGDMVLAEDVTLDVNVVLEGRIRLAEGVVVGAGSVLRDCDLGPGTRVAPYSVLEGVRSEGNCDIGPFARLRPGTSLAVGARIGNFVETKQTEVGPGSKVNHLTYLGDTCLGADVNVGAGTITCNYDGALKHRTEIGDRAFIGSNSSLVAPLKLGEDVTVGAGSTLTEDVSEAELAVARGRQRNISGWKRPTKGD